MNHVLSAHGLSKTFAGKTVVHDVTIQVGLGEVVGIFGPNGAGKTTTFRMMVGLQTPDAGTIQFHGQDVTQWPLYKRARLGLRYLPQEPSIFGALTVEDNLKAVAELLEPTRALQKAVVCDLLEQFRLTGMSRTPARVLSGGQRRRLEIARALIGKPSHILMDEPLAGIDPRSIQEFTSLLIQLTEQKVGILVTDHNVKDMLPMVHRAYVVHEGWVLCQGTSQDIYNDPRVRQVYLGDQP
jgi:lipopolysaccharide export system ATP-binding protein